MFWTLLFLLVIGLMISKSLRGSSKPKSNHSHHHFSQSHTPFIFFNDDHDSHDHSDCGDSGSFGDSGGGDCGGGGGGGGD